MATAWRIDKRLGWSFPEYDADMEVDGDRLYVALKAPIRRDVSGPRGDGSWDRHTGIFSAAHSCPAPR
ncbi:hypothetical protein ADJ76_06705 [Schaalia meyeri]|uniref:Uncharacterized protein n=1 Tax=Schaalia meyeri TaxID=52773 RepID=A0AAP9Y6Q2_9ACTO|nr:hypothetical protein [Schaalia meyeri]AKU65473.1 hypothetical protein ADJ76_06705 [Schaalia meyeri]QQC43828.1 hypothetical protein I6H42_08700 [Schaalia meyeri]